MTENVAGQGQVQSPSSGVGQGLYEESVSQKGPLGARQALEDGRAYRYAQFTAVAVAAGVAVAQDATSQKAGEMAATAVSDSAGDAADIAASDTVTRLYFQDTDILTAANSDDVFAGGYLHHLNSATGGYTYKIRSNTYTASTSVMQVDLYDSILENMDSQDEASITGNLYVNVTIANNGSDDNVSGVTVRNVTASYYAWVQTWGPATILADESVGTIAQGTLAVLSDGVNGAAEPWNVPAQNSEDDTGIVNWAEPYIGMFLGAATNGNYVGVFLQISP